MNSQDQEDEQSCFSDNTYRDAVLNALGIENVWLGCYQRAYGSMLQGSSPRDLVAAKDAMLAPPDWTLQSRKCTPCCQGCPLRKR